MKKLIAIPFILFTIISIAQITSQNYSFVTDPAEFHSKTLIDKNSNVYVLSSSKLYKYNASGVQVFVKNYPAGIGFFNMCMARDSMSIFITGGYTGTSFNIDGVILNDGIAEGSILLNVSLSDGAANWGKLFEQNTTSGLPLITFPYRITAVDVSLDAIYTIRNFNTTIKIRKHNNTNGDIIWERVITVTAPANSGFTLENKDWPAWVDDAGNQFYAAVSDNADATAYAINNVTYPIASLAFLQYFALDANGNTLWTNNNINRRGVNVTQVLNNGEVYVSGWEANPNNHNYSTNPFDKLIRCKETYNIFKGDILTGKMIWRAHMPYMTQGGYVTEDGTLYGLNGIQSNALAPKIGSFEYSYQIPVSTHALFMGIVSGDGIVQKYFTICRNSTFYNNGTQYFHKAPNGSFFFNARRSNNYLTFENGTAPAVVTTDQPWFYGVSFNEITYPARHTTAWTGASSGLWFTASNWSNGIPTDSSNVIIPANATRYPSAGYEFYDFTNSKWAVCGNLTVDAGADYFYPNGATIKGYLINNGTIRYKQEISASNYIFYGWGATSFSGTGKFVFFGDSGGIIDYAYFGKNKVEVNLTLAGNSVRFPCVTIDSLLLIRGIANVDPSTFPTAKSIYISGGMSWGLNNTGSTNSHVNGLLYHRINSTTVNLPIGNGTTAQPVLIQFSSLPTISYVSARFSNTSTGTTPNPAVCMVNGKPIAARLNAGIWSISPDVPLESGNSYSFKGWLKGSTNASTAPYYGLIKRTNSTSDWIGAGDYVPAYDSAGYAIATGINISSFSDFAIGISAQTVPVTRLELSGIKNNIGNLLKWFIEGTNINSVELQRSADGILFSTIHSIVSGELQFNDNSTTKINYYYRLKTISDGGRIGFSNIVFLNASGVIENVKYDFVNQQIKIDHSLTGNTTMSLYNNIGQLVIHVSVKPADIISLKHLAPGVYTAILHSTNSRIENKRIVK